MTVARARRLGNLSEVRAKNIFISHIHEHDHKLGAMKQLLGRYGLKARDWSINSSRPNNAKSHNYIKYGILGPRIGAVSTVVVLISTDAHKSKWVDWEIAYAHRLGKRIVGVWAHGNKDCTVPENLNRYADAVVGWQGDSIIKAINGKINNWQTSSGELCAPRLINRHGC
jgi:MTH538 TIR-like domain (DUF1863)